MGRRFGESDKKCIASAAHCLDVQVCDATTVEACTKARPKKITGRPENAPQFSNIILPNKNQINITYYQYIKAIHIIFIVTWFSGLFYIPRLFIYNTEADEKDEPAKSILHDQFRIMIKRLWLGITWPSAILTVIFGGWMAGLYGSIPEWLWTKLAFVCGLYMYHFTLHKLYREQQRGIFKYSSQKLRIWNEVATIFLVAIVMLASVKQSMSVAWGIAGLILFIIILMSAIRIYKMLRK